MIETRKLTYKYSDSPEIAFPDFKVNAGQALMVCGESGCGKTTLLHLLAGLRSPTRGEVIVEGKNIADLSAPKMDQFRGQHIGIVYQQSFFIESLTVKDNLLISPYTLDKDRASTTADRLDIGKILNRYPKQLSVGQLQRATIARAVMNSPKLILADEPTSALDNKNCSFVIDLLLEEAKTNNAALIVVTHDDRVRTKISDCLELSPLIH